MAEKLESLRMRGHHLQEYPRVSVHCFADYSNVSAGRLAAAA